MPELSHAKMKILASETGVTSVWEKIEAHGKVQNVLHIETPTIYVIDSMKFTAQNDLRW